MSEQPDAPAGEVILETGSVKIVFTPGNSTSPDVVLSFAGIAQSMGGITPMEFARSISNQTVVRDSFFVIDRGATWFNACGPQIVDSLAPRLAGRRVHTLGNSMGGFGAILFSRLLAPCASATAFVPQYSIHRDTVAFETRWADHAASVARWLYQTCMAETAGPSPPSPVIFCGADRPGDLDHARAIHRDAGENCAVFVVDGCGHNVARHLRQCGALAHVLDAAMTNPGDERAIGNILTRCGIAYTAWPSQVENSG